MKKFTTLIICALLVLIALLAARILIATAPEAERKRPPRQTLLVETLQTRIQNETVKIEVAGTVIPAQEIELRTPVNGKILWTSDQFIAGGRVKKGEVLVQLDTNNYTLAIENANAGLAQAQFEYEMELGRQDIAKREWALLKADDATEQERALALRIPHLKASKAALASAKARVRRALREGNVVWLDTDGKLDLQPVEVLFRESDSILVRGLPADSFLITTDIAAPVPGQPVNRGEKEQPAQPEGATHDA